VIALCDAAETERLGRARREAVRWTPGATATDVTTAYAAIGLLGPRTPDVLSELSDTEPPLGEDDVDTPPSTSLRLAAVPRCCCAPPPAAPVALTEAVRGACSGTRSSAPDARPASATSDGRGHAPLPARPMSEAPKTPSEAIAPVKIHAPSERNRKLAAFLGAPTRHAAEGALARAADDRRAPRDVDHSWVHLQIVLNMALRLFRLLHSTA
jgi:hypothetical protein